MTAKSKSLLVAAAVVAVLGIGFYLWWNAPVRAATRTLLKVADSIQIEGDESPLARQGKAARLRRAISDPVDIKFREAGREGAWSAESLQARYASAALSARSASVALEDLEAQRTAAGTVEIVALLKANYVGQGSGEKKIERRCKWVMQLEGGAWVIASFREIGSEE